MPTATDLPINSSATAVQMANEIFGQGVVVNGATYFGDALRSAIYSNGDTVSTDANPGDTGVILSTGYARDFIKINGVDDVAGDSVTLATGQTITLNPDGTLRVDHDARV